MTGRGTRRAPLRPRAVGGADAARCGHTRTALRSAPHRVPADPEQSPSSFLADDDVGRVRMFHTDDVVAGVDVMNLASHPARKIAEEIDRGIADLLDRDAAAQRRVVLVPFEDVAEVANAR